jgi:hypothetical protein
MASGTQKYKYETDAGNFFFARTDDSADLASVRGTEPTGTTTESITFEFSKRSKAVGCKARHCILKLKVEADDDGTCLVPPQNTTKRVIVLKPSTNPPTGTEVTVNGRVYIVGSVVGEQMR